MGAIKTVVSGESVGVAFDVVGKEAPLVGAMMDVLEVGKGVQKVTIAVLSESLTEKDLTIGPRVNCRSALRGLSTLPLVERRGD